MLYLCVLISGKAANEYSNNVVKTGHNVIKLKISQALRLLRLAKQSTTKAAQVSPMRHDQCDWHQRQETSSALAVISVISKNEHDTCSNDSRHDGNNLRGGAEASQVSTSIVLNLAKEKTVTTWKKHQQAQNIAYSGVFLKSTTHPSADKGGIDQAPCQKCLVVQRAAKRPFGPPYLRWNFA